MRLCLSFILITQLLYGQVWVSLPDFPGSKRDDGVAVVVNQKAYFGTGLQEWNTTIDFYALDLNSFSWKAIPNMPNTTERQYACAFAAENSFYVFGGDGVGGALNDLYKFDILQSNWMAMSSKPGTGWIGASCLNFGDEVIFTGGRSQTGLVDRKVWQYSIGTNTWQQKNDLPFAGRWRASTCVLNGLGYFMFGIDSANTYHKEFYSYDPVNDQWTKLMDLPFTNGRAYASLNVANNRLVLFGGKDSLNNYYKDLWYYHPGANTWLQGLDLPAAARKGGMSVGYGESMIYSCGIKANDQRLTESWMTHVPVGIREGEANSHFTYYPNPAEEFVYLITQKSTLPFSLVKYRLIGCFGNEVFPLTEMKEDGKIDLSFIPKGIYFLTIYSKEAWQETIKLIKN